VAQVEIFGPVLVAMTFRTPAERGRARQQHALRPRRQVWSENINLALDIAPKIKAGVVWVNSHQPVRRRRRLRRLPRIRLRPRGRARRHVRIRGVALAMHEPMGVIGIAAPEDAPLLGFISLVAPAIAMGNTVVAIPSERASLAATDLYSVLETSDVPDGVVNIVTGAKAALALVLAEHDDVNAVWYHGAADACAAVERASASNMKRTHVERVPLDWFHARAEGPEFLREATQVKNIWIPYGE
jgi:acyl-CoA reductase-like NAD-dependent aldehyde dehydrogenase